MADGIGLMDLTHGMARRGVSIAPESGLFVALLVAEALRDAPGGVAVESVRITGEGCVDLPGRRGASDEQAAVASIVAVCDAVLKPPTVAARALIARVRSGNVASVESLRAELESLLVPLNRGAARRVLGRFVREHVRTEGAEPQPRTGDRRTPEAPAEKSSNPAASPGKTPERDRGPSAQDTAPDRGPTRASPPPGPQIAGRNALDTEPDAAAGITALLAHPVMAVSDDGVSHSNLLNPNIPRPPSLGTLSLLPGASDGSLATGTEPALHDRTPRRRVAKPSATDTAIDGGLRSDALATLADPNHQSPRAMPLAVRRRSGSNVVLILLLGSLLVALVVLAFAGMRR